MILGRDEFWARYVEICSGLFDVSVREDINLIVTLIDFGCALMVEIDAAASLQKFFRKILAGFEFMKMALPCAKISKVQADLMASGGTMTENADNKDVLVLTSDLVAAYVSNNPVPTGDLAGLIGQVYRALKEATTASTSSAAEKQKPAVPIKKSVTPDFIISLEDGRKFKSLRRHLSADFGMTPDEYRSKWGLPVDYPMVAPNYAATRSALAKKMGLGRKPKEIAPKAKKTTVRKAKS